MQRPLREIPDFPVASLSPLGQTDGTITDEPERLQQLVEWAVYHAPRFHSAIQQTLSAGDGGEAAT